MSLVSGGLTGVIIALWRNLLNNEEVMMRTSHLLLRNYHHSNDNASQNESKWTFQWRKRRTDLISQNKFRDEPEWRCWPGSPL